MVKNKKTHSQIVTADKKKLRKENLLVAKKCVYNRDKNICQHCNKLCSGSDRHASHVIPVSRDGRLAMDPMNMKVLCYHCHINRRHKHPIEAGEWYTKKFPERWVYLKQQYIEGGKGSISLIWLEQSLQKNKEYLKSLESNIEKKV